MSKDRLAQMSGMTVYVEELANIWLTNISSKSWDYLSWVPGLWGGPVAISGRGSLYALIRVCLQLVVPLRKTEADLQNEETEWTVEGMPYSQLWVHGPPLQWLLRDSGLTGHFLISLHTSRSNHCLSNADQCFRTESSKFSFLQDAHFGFIVLWAGGLFPQSSANAFGDSYDYT